MELLTKELLESLEPLPERERARAVRQMYLALDIICLELGVERSGEGQRPAECAGELREQPARWN